MTITSPYTSTRSASDGIKKNFKKPKLKPKTEPKMKWVSAHAQEISRYTKMLFAFMFPEDRTFSYRVGYLNDKDEIVVPIGAETEKIIGTLDTLYPVYVMELPPVNVCCIGDTMADCGLAAAFLIKNILN